MEYRHNGSKKSASAQSGVYYIYRKWTFHGWLSALCCGWQGEDLQMLLARSPSIGENFGNTLVIAGRCHQYPAGRKQATTKAAEKLMLAWHWGVLFFAWLYSCALLCEDIHVFFFSKILWVRIGEKSTLHLAADVLQSSSSTLRKRKQAIEIDILDACSICFTAKPNKNRFQQMITPQDKFYSSSCKSWGNRLQIVP